MAHLFTIFAEKRELERQLEASRQLAEDLAGALRSTTTANSELKTALAAAVAVADSSLAELKKARQEITDWSVGSDVLRRELLRVKTHAESLASLLELREKTLDAARQEATDLRTVLRGRTEGSELRCAELEKKLAEQAAVFKMRIEFQKAEISRQRTDIAALATCLERSDAK